MSLQSWNGSTPRTRGKDIRHDQRAEDESSCKSAAILLDSDDFRISKPFGMDQATLLPLRSSLGRKPGRATQAKVRARKKKGKEQKRNEEKKRTKKEMKKRRTKKKK
ncbi:hypothetical protein HYC85_028978 [Camellia sinensis]|uniref:Uncharacterized protein n=1 Tax=Camellia sinensis TaxID=4442 RepID=A0A7J7FXD6_CAMSI|nr:hypothetical protein HYC85_028978 [Camellia sinensis]